MSRVLLKGGIVYDGSGAEGAALDVLVDGESISDLAPRLPADLQADEIVDCRGLIVAPGFIDVHVHSDFAALVYPLAQNRVLAGVTTELSGNCGGSPFPMGGELRNRRVLQLRTMGVKCDWDSAEGYFNRCHQVGSSVNRGYLVGHGNLRALTVGYGASRATTDQLETMARMLEEGLAAGAWGLSSGLIYPPGCYAPTEELAFLARSVGRVGGMYASHIRSEGTALLEAVDEFITIMDQGGCRGLISHVKTAGPDNWNKIDALVDRLQGARRHGLLLYGDSYPYTASMTGLLNILFPDWIHEDGLEATVERLRDPAMRPRLEEGRAQSRPEPDWPKRVQIADCTLPQNRRLAGMNLEQLAKERGKDPLSAAIELLIEEKTCVEAIYFGMSEENLKRIYGLPFIAAASDSSVRDVSATDAAKPHPRTFGTPVRFLSTYVRDAKLMTLGEGIRRLTGLPAEIVGWNRRGRLAPGAFADITILKLDELQDRATYEQPAVAPAGVRHVMVNGQWVLRDGQHTGAKPGRVLRRGDIT